MIIKSFTALLTTLLCLFISTAHVDAKPMTAGRIDPMAAAVKHYNAGVKLYKADRMNDACDEFRTAIHLAPSFAPAHANLGLVLRGSDPVAAMKQLQLAVQLDPDLAEAHNVLGAIYYQQKMYQKAADEYRTVLQLTPSSQEGKTNLKLTLAKMSSHRINDTD